MPVRTRAAVAVRTGHPAPGSQDSLCLTAQRCRHPPPRVLITTTDPAVLAAAQPPVSTASQAAASSQQGLLVGPVRAMVCVGWLHHSLGLGGGRATRSLVRQLVWES